MLKKSLQLLGLSDKESKVYVSLITLGKMGVSSLAKSVGLPRQTTYSILKNLVRRELVEQSNENGVKSFFADVSRLEELLENQKKSIENVKQSLAEEMSILRSKQKQPPEFPKVEYYEGRMGLIRLFEDILRQHRVGGVKEFRGYGVNTFRETLGKFLYTFVRKRHRYGTKTKLFVGEGRDDFNIVDDSSRYGREIKRLNMKPQKAGMYLVGNRIYLFSYADAVGVMIENKAMVELLQNVFEDHWKRVQH